MYSGYGRAINSMRLRQIRRRHRKNAGGTWSLLSGHVSDIPYYAVALSGAGIVLRGQNLSIAPLRTFIWDMQRRMNPEDVIGTWYDTETDCSYLDVVRLVAHRDEALRLAREHQQRSIYDLKRHETIPCRLNQNASH